MKIQRLFALIFLIVLVLSGCSNKEITPSESSEISVLDTETVSEEITTQPIETENNIPISEKNKESETVISSSAEIEMQPPITDIPQTETVSQATSKIVSSTTIIPKTTPEAVLPSVTESPEKEVQETTAEEISHPIEPTVDIIFYINYAKDFAKNIGLKYDNTATDCWDNPITVTGNTRHITADIESRLNRYKNIEGFEYICVWYEKVSENTYEIYIGYA